MPIRLAARASVLATFGASASLTAELLAYDSEGLGDAEIPAGVRFPLDDEPCVGVWREYSRLASASGLRTLGDRLVQLRFPIGQGISQSEEYRAATRRGVLAAASPSATGLALTRPDDCSVTVHPTWAGSIAIVTAGCRDDFVSLFRAFAARNEPVEVPASQGAAIIAGYNNWDRVRRLQDRWMLDHPDQEFSFDLLAGLKDQYQDRFVLLSPGWYSGVPPRTMGLASAEWDRMSLVIRREHECAHYWTRRVLSVMRNRILDEVIADYCGIFAACGRLRGDWLLAFLGVQEGKERSDGRLHNYRGQPPLSDAAFAILGRITRAAVENLETFDRRHADVLDSERGLLLILLTLSRMTLEDLACRQAQTLLDGGLERARALASDAVAGGLGPRRLD